MEEVTRDMIEVVKKWFGEEEYDEVPDEIMETRRQDPRGGGHPVLRAGDHGDLLRRELPEVQG